MKQLPTRPGLYVFEERDDEDVYVYRYYGNNVWFKGDTLTDVRDLPTTDWYRLRRVV